MVQIGIMQGRLSMARGERIQSFPAENWREEFARARTAHLACIEWIYEEETEEVNPLRTDAGLASVRELSANSGVSVWSVCADYYMTARLVGAGGRVDRDRIDHLRWLLKRCGLLGVRYIVLPFVDSSSLRTPAEIEGLAVVLQEVLPAAEAARVEVHLETDFKPSQLAAFLARIGHPLIKANHDIGNSASLGFDPTEELTVLGPWLGSVHVKDRIRGGGTVALGTGHADLPTSLCLIRRTGFPGPLILQVARQEGCSEVEWAIHNRRLVERYWEAAEGA